jgi:hypothetical protein
MKEDLATEKLAADLILRRGARIKMRAPLFLRLLGKKDVSVIVRAPLEGTMMRVASYYLGTGLAQEKLQNISHEQALAVMAVHGKAINKCVACGILNGYWSGKYFTNLLAWYLRWHCKPEELLMIANILLLYGGVSDFMSTTRSVRLMKLTGPRLGQDQEGS